MADQNKELLRQLELKVEEIDATLASRVSEKYKTREKELLEASPQVKIGQEIKEIETEIAKLEKQVRELHDKIGEKEKERSKYFDTKMDDIANSDLRDLIRKNSKQLNPYTIYRTTGQRTSKEALQTAEEVYDSVEYSNACAFKKIVQDLRMNWGLCVTIKEKRALLLAFMNKDWQQLGINIPTPAYMQGFDVKDGRIQLPTTPALPQKIKVEEE